VQRTCGRSTGTKNPAYRDKYVDTLVGRTPSTSMPIADAECGREQSEGDESDATRPGRRELEALREAGSRKGRTVTEEEVEAGSGRRDMFIRPYEQILDGIEAQREAIDLGARSQFDSSLPGRPSSR